MKIKTTPQLNKLITHYHILKLSLNSKAELKINRILLDKITNLIYYYNYNKKRIVFVGFPKEFDIVLKKTKHMQMPELTFNMMLNNQVQNQTSKNISKLILKLKKKADLIVLYNTTNQQIELKKNYLFNIPIITINKKLKRLNHKKNYDFLIKKPESLNFIIGLLKIILKNENINSFIKKSKN